jgi:protein O-GlcNAc transferase
MHMASRLPEAKDLYRQALTIEPSPEAWQGLGALAREVGALDAAVQSFGSAVALAPDAPELRLQHAEVLQASGRLAQAVTQLQAACRLRPTDALAWERLGIAQQSLGDIDAATESYERACRLASPPGARLKLATLFSPIISSHAAMLAERARADAALDTLLADDALHTEQPLHAAVWTNFYLAFHGENNRALQSKYAALYERMCPSLAYVASHCQRPREPGARIRVGLLSNFFSNHSIGRTSRGLFANFAREEFEVTAIFVTPGIDDDYSRFIREHAEHSIDVPRDLEQARRVIVALQLDVLFYQDIGMESFSYFLAFSRLARVQCVSFGHPDTTGIPAMDYFVSNDLYETGAAAGHYSEELFLLHDLGSLAYYYRPTLPQPPKARAAFGLDDDDHLYLCPQNLFKFHPDMDSLIAQILRRDIRGKVVVIEGRIDHWTELMRRRWNAVMPDVAARIVFLPRQNSADYLNVIALADVMLDTVHFNGMNTSLEAFAVGTPVVTSPGEFQRGRHTQAMYRKMGFTECVATDAARYVEIAVRLGTDPAYRETVRQEIMRRNGVLFEDARVAREFERFFRTSVAQAEVAGGGEARATG